MRGPPRAPPQQWMDVDHVRSRGAAGNICSVQLERFRETNQPGFAVSFARDRAPSPRARLEFQCLPWNFTKISRSTTPARSDCIRWDLASQLPWAIRRSTEDVARSAVGAAARATSSARVVSDRHPGLHPGRRECGASLTRAWLSADSLLPVALRVSVRSLVA